MGNNLKLVRHLLLLIASSTLAACQPTGGASLSDCVKERSAALAPGPNVQQLDALAGFCYDLLSDQERVRRLSATAKIYEDQVFQNHVLLVLVVLITLSGVALAGLQLWASYKLAEAGKGILADGGNLNLSPGSVAVKSSVVGVVILALSLAFFIIFVREVYKITPAESGGQSTRPAPAAPPPGKEIPR